MAMPRILILGGGFGGIRTALSLGSRLRGHAEITLIDRNGYHLFTPALYEVASAYGLDRDRFNRRLRNTVAVPYEEIFQGSQVRFVQAEIREVNVETMAVTTQGGHLFRYDYLVIGLGAQTADYGIPGVRDYSCQFKTLDDAIMISEKTMQLFQELEEGTRQAPVRICIVGAGFTGIELAAELALYGRKMCTRCGLSGKPFLVYLFEAGPRILPTISDGERERIRARLTELGVVITENTSIEALEGSVLKLRGGQKLSSDMTVWSAGIRPNQFLRSIGGLELNGGGKLIVGEHLHVPRRQNVFGVGDNIEFIDHATQKPIPSLAYLAADHGRIVAQNIVRSIKGKEMATHKPFYELWVAPVGGKFAVAHLWWGISVKGFMGWIVRELVDLRYFLQILPMGKALKFFLRQQAVFLKND